MKCVVKLIYDDQDHPEAVIASKAVCEKLEDGLAKLTEVK